MTPDEEAFEVAGLARAAEEIFTLFQSKMGEDGPDSVPPMLMIVRDDRGLEPNPDGMIERKYVGVIIPEDRDKDERGMAIARVLAEVPSFKAYCLLMHANTWVADDPHKGKSKDDLPPVSIEEIKATGKHLDSLVLILVRPDESKMIKCESYIIKEDPDGTHSLEWTNTLTSKDFPDKDISGELHPRYQQAFLNEDDFK